MPNIFIRDDSRGKVSTLCRHFEKKKIHMNLWLILNGYRDTVFKYKSTVDVNKERGITYCQILYYF